MFQADHVIRVERTSDEIEDLIAEAEVVIRASMPQIREDRATKATYRRRAEEVRQRAEHLVHYCLDRPVMADG